MQKTLISADKVLIGIGQLFLTRPLFFGMLLISAMIATMLNHERSYFNQEKTISAAIAFTKPSFNHQSFENPLSADQPLGQVSNAAIVDSVVQMNDTVSKKLIHTARKTAANIAPILAETKVLSTGTTAKLSMPANTLLGQIKHSLSIDAHKAGLSSKQVTQLAQIFKDKSVIQNMRVGDEFKVLVDNTKPAKDKAHKISGGILAAQLEVGNKTYQLTRFTDPQGVTDYYNPQGESLHDALVRAPIKFTHISSYFSSHRFDPILGFVRPHEGVDYAAPVGTPIEAAGDGVLAEADYKGGYGNAIIIKHDAKYSTLYGHLSHFAPSIHEGVFVKKGQVIGYVGETGFATGPHLHFEIRVNDVPNNPLTVTLPTTSIPKAYRAKILAQSNILLAQLNIKNNAQWAQRKDNVKRF